MKKANQAVWRLYSFIEKLFFNMCNLLRKASVSIKRSLKYTKNPSTSFPHWFELVVAMLGVVLSVLGVFIAIKGNELSELQKIAIEFENQPRFYLEETRTMVYDLGNKPSGQISLVEGVPWKTDGTVRISSAIETDLAWVNAINEHSNEKETLYLQGGIAADTSLVRREYIAVTISAENHYSNNIPSLKFLIPIEDRARCHNEFLYYVSDAPSLYCWSSSVKNIRRQHEYQGIRDTFRLRATPLIIYTISYTNCFNDRIEKDYVKELWERDISDAPLQLALSVEENKKDFPPSPNSQITGNYRLSEYIIIDPIESDLAFIYGEYSNVGHEEKMSWIDDWANYVIDELLRRYY